MAGGQHLRCLWTRSWRGLNLSETVCCSRCWFLHVSVAGGKPIGPAGATAWEGLQKGGHFGTATVRASPQSPFLSMQQVQLLLGSSHAHIQQPHFFIVSLQVALMCHVALQASMRHEGFFTPCSPKPTYMSIRQ